MNHVRVLHLHSGNLYGGIETVLATLAHNLVDDGTTQTFALCFEGRLSKQLRGLGATVEILGDVRASRPASVRAARRWLRGWLAANPADVIVTHLPWTQAVFGPAIRKTACPCVQWVHGRIDGWIGQWARLSLPDALVCNSAFTMQSLPSGYRRVPAAVIHYPLELPPAGNGSARAALRAALDTSPSDVVILQASRFEPLKGHEVHLRALARLRHVPGWTLWMVGGAQRPAEVAYERQVKALAAELNLRDRIRFAGEQADVASYLYAADVYCQPNVGPEAFGLAYIEALAAGLPVVASGSWALPEIVDERTGLLVEIGNDVAVAAALERLIVDAPLRRRLGEAGPLRAAQLCDPQQQIVRLHAFLSGVAGQRLVS